MEGDLVLMTQLSIQLALVLPVEDGGHIAAHSIDCTDLPHLVHAPPSGRQWSELPPHELFCPLRRRTVPKNNDIPYQLDRVGQTWPLFSARRSKLYSGFHHIISIYY